MAENSAADPVCRRATTDFRGVIVLEWATENRSTVPVNLAGTSKDKACLGVS